MDLEKFLTIFELPKNLSEEQKKEIWEEYDFFDINYNLWYTKTIEVEESNPNKPLNYDDRLFNFLNMQEENVINLVKLRDETLNGVIYFDFKAFWKENYYRMSSKKLSIAISDLVKNIFGESGLNIV